MSKSPYQIFNEWLFDRNIDTPIPKPRDGVDILKYNSPITHTYLISLFLRNGPLNEYLDKYFNNIGLRYLKKEELFYFIKQCVIDFRVKKRDLVFFRYQRQDKLFNNLRERFPQFKNNDVSLLCELIERSEERDRIYESIGLDVPKKKKVKVKNKQVKSKKMSSSEFLERHFSILEEVPP